MAHKAKEKSSKKGSKSQVSLTGDAGVRAPRVIGRPITSETATVVSKVESDPKAAQNPRQAILTAFGKLGGVRWLTKLAKRYPKDFAGLLAKAMPQDINVTGTVGYVPQAIPVEVREAIPGECIDVTPRPQPVADEPDPLT
jgi:hypothetical protein